MSFSNAIAALFSKENKEKLEVEHGKFNSTRLILVVGFVCFVLSAWVFKGLVTDANIQRVFWLVVVYIIGNSVTKSVALFVNGWIKNTQAKVFSADGTLDANEKEVLLSVAATGSKSSTSP